MQDTVEDPPQRPPGWSALVGTCAIMFMLGMGNCVVAFTSALDGPGMTYTANAPASGPCMRAELVKEFFIAAHDRDGYLEWTATHSCDSTKPAP